MDYKKGTYYSILTVLLIANLFCFLTQQWAIYDSYLNRIYFDDNWGWSILAITFFTILLWIFSLLLDFILQPKEVDTKFIILGNLFPLFLWCDLENQILAVITALISMSCTIYWYFFTFYWKKRKLK